MLGLDMRTVPGQNHDALVRQLEVLAGPDVAVERELDFPPVWTDPETPWCRKVRQMAERHLHREIGVESVQFFTDAASWKSARPGLPVMILGPGDPGLAHRTDEYCPLADLHTATALYADLIRDWYGL